MVEGKVLIIDDAHAVIDALRAALMRAGVDEDDLLVANNAADAVDLFNAHRPALVFMDVTIGPDRGDQLAIEILNAHPGTRIIMITGLDLGDERVRDAVSAGAYDVIQKPLRLARIREVLDLVDAEARGLRRV